MQLRALVIEGHTRICKLRREVSGHHLLLCHWVRERALIIARRVVARALGPMRGGSDRDEDPEDEDELLMNLWPGGGPVCLGCQGLTCWVWATGGSGMGTCEHSGVRLSFLHFQEGPVHAGAWDQCAPR